MTGMFAHDALLVSLIAVLFGAIVGTVGIRRGRQDWVQLAFGAIYANFVLVTIATGAMIYALVTHDYSVSYVAQVGSNETPLFYTVISLWGALEGSILFWAWVLGAYSTAVIWINRKRPGTLVPWAAVTLLVVALFFAILLVGPANPFMPVFPVPADGPGPNPLLQNHILMAVHPPLLYLGYVGMSVPFAFAAGAMFSGEVASDDWIKISRTWTMIAWGFLSAAIIAGMWWSYEVLGWGGYWAWDPVENASFLPWLTATAYLHSVMVQERRGMLKQWNLNLMVGTFVLTILGTFLTRSGILSSVHAFTTGTIGYYFLGFIAFVLIGALVMVAGVSEKLKTRGRLESATSRETVFLLNNLFLTAFCFTVLVGTLFPLVAEAARGIKVTVGEPFFNKMTLPLITALIFLLGVGPALPWGVASKAQMKQKLLPPIAGAVVLGAVALIAGARNPYAVLIFAFVGYSAFANGREYWIGMKARHAAHGENWLTALSRLVSGNRRRYGGYVAHFGVLFVALGIAASQSFRREREATLKPGETITVAGHTARLKEVWGRQEPQRAVIGATMEVLDNGRVVATADPRMNFYPTQSSPVPTPQVVSSIGGDLYFNLMAFDQNGAHATVKLIVQPLVPWIWFGGGIVVLGAIIGVFPNRKRRTVVAPARQPVAAVPIPVATTGGGEA
ncbi:MAG: heme lyase CcmF/NrfE family subunit [Gemmatimonadota bacterium]|nr:heme lyase CcmF/NrfE family subunit [Gemmatimonadota bacterium]